MKPLVALAHLADSRADFLQKRQALFDEEVSQLTWLREAADTTESGLINDAASVAEFAARVRGASAHSLILHLPIWGDPILAVRMHDVLALPLLLLGNQRPETSSIVGLLGAGGALDQVGAKHLRVFDHTTESGRRHVLAFARAAGARQALRGQTLGLFGGRSLGILTASADPAQWLRLFGVDIQQVDQMEIAERARTLPKDAVAEHTAWLTGRLAGIAFNGGFTADGFDRQVRSYLATRQLAQAYGFDFIGVKCQRELSDGYATQCVAHMLANGQLDADGDKPTLVHACEADADGALTMQLLKLLSGGSPSALFDIRWLDPDSGVWTLANCGALPASFFATAKDPSGLSGVRAVPHAFGEGGGGAFPGIVAAQPVTLARLCRRAGEYWMAIVAGEAQSGRIEDLARTTAAFPQAFVRAAAGEGFLQEYGSNHIHAVAGDVVEELQAFCRLAGLPYKVW